MRLKDFLGKLGGVGIVTLGDRLASLGLGVLLIRWLGTETYGLYSFTMATSALLLIGVRFGLPEWLMREIASQQDNPELIAGRGLHRTTLTLVATLSVAGLALGTLAALIFVSPGPTRTALIIGLALLPPMALIDTLNHALRGWGRVMSASVLSTILPTLLNLTGVALLFLAFHLDGSAPDALLTRFISVVVSVTFAFMLLKRVYRPERIVCSNRPAFSRSDAFRGAIPFMLTGGVAVILARTDVFMLGLLSGFEQGGLYNIAVQAGGTVMLVLGMSNNITTQEFARLHSARNKAEFERFAMMSARTVAAVGLPLGVFLISFGDPLLRFFFGPDTGEAYGPLVILVSGYIVALLFGAPGYILSMSGNVEVSLRIITFSAVLNIVMNAIAIPFAGATGAAAATSVSLLMQRIIMVVMVRRRVGISCGVVRFRRK